MGKAILVIVLIVVVFGCRDSGKQNKAMQDYMSIQKLIDSIPPDTVKPVLNTTFKGVAFPLFFEAAYHKSTSVNTGHGKYVFSIFDAGKIKIESGRIIACDPITMHDEIAFTQRFPIGSFPVQLAMANTGSDMRVAFSRILFSNAEVAKWESAIIPGQKPKPINDSDYYCYGVDGGVGLFIDSISNSVFNNLGQKLWEKVFIINMEKINYTGYTYDFSGHNLTTFSTGYGDGCYGTYIGFDKDGNVCRLLTDFSIIAWWEMKK
ncbi:MAG: DUF4241 domain-containing protein [Sphingobacteriales bacterium JAD_PAG50586_3]|nr:MAG: DUF4241 domain-containing protein [Sphingobacteriales bacterium JAD_PAG50586_3]